MQYEMTTIKQKLYKSKGFSTLISKTPPQKRLHKKTSFKTKQEQNETTRQNGRSRKIRNWNQRKQGSVKLLHKQL